MSSLVHIVALACHRFYFAGMSCIPVMPTRRHPLSFNFPERNALFDACTMNLHYSLFSQSNLNEDWLVFQT
jgi:hypothetical protein